MTRDDDDISRPKREKTDFDVMSIEELEEHIETLNAEIEQTRAMIEKKRAAQNAAAGFFKN
ncbi:MAG: DUF1192 domain-containing protein [Alphaproteobacteria bacterium]|nr:MAG: DUF1192 domain-containing protein [Alphaproteobacteria bacterium]